MDYRTMLVKLSNEISKEELGRLKYSVMGGPDDDRAVSRRQLEEITEGHHLWEALESLEFLSNTAEGMQNLYDKIKYSCTGRRDLLTIIAEYSRNNLSYEIDDQEPVPPSSRTVYVRAEIDFITGELGKNWKNLARALGLSDTEIEQVITRHPFDLQQQIHNMFTLWGSKTEPEDINRQILMKALRKAQLVRLAERIETLPPYY